MIVGSLLGLCLKDDCIQHKVLYRTMHLIAKPTLGTTKHDGN